MGFVGDWGKESILDKPKSNPDSVYDTLGLVSGSSYLGSQFDVRQFKEVINQDKVGFSPNSDDHYDSVNLVLGLLRSAKTLDVDVVKEQSENAESLVHITTTKNVRKPLYKNKNNVVFTNGYWNGEIFNVSTGKYEPIEDGQYYMRLKAGIESINTKYQYTYLPFKVDTQKPVLEIVSKGIEGSEYVVKFKAVDNDSGIGLAEDGVGAYLDNEDKTTLYDEDDGNKDDIYTFKIDASLIQDGKKHTITVGAIDEVFNVKTEVIVLEDNSIVFDNATSDLIGPRNKYLSTDNSMYKLQGYVGGVIKELLVNGEKAEINEKSFTVNIPLVEGENIVDFVAKDENGNIIVSSDDSTRFTLTKDTTPPNLEITSHDVNELQVLTSNKIIISGRVSDTSNLPVSVRAGFTNFTVEADGTFKGEASIDWTRVLKVVARDKAGNETFINLKTVFEDGDKSNFSLYMTSGLGTFNYINADSKLIEADDMLILEGHVNKKIKHLIIGDEIVNIDEGLRFSHRYKLKEVNNHISIQAIANDDSVIYEGSYAVYYDKTVPNISIEGSGTIEEDVIYTNENPYKLKATASDNGHGYRLFINGNEVLNYDYMASMGESDNEQSAEVDIDSSNGNTLLIEIADSFGNSVSKNYKFVYDDVAPEITLNGINENMEVIASSSINVATNEESSIEVSIDGQVYNGEQLDTLGNYTLVVKAIDKAGNITENTYQINVIEERKVEFIQGFVKVISKETDLTNQVELRVELLSEKINGINNNYDLYDIYFVDKNTKERVEFNQEAIVDIGIRRNEEVLKVAYVESNEVVEEKQYELLQANRVKFIVPHFSKYAVIYKSVPKVKEIIKSNNEVIEDKPKWTCEDEGKVWSEEKQACILNDSINNNSTYKYKVVDTSEKSSILIYMLCSIISLTSLMIIKNK